jgi:type IV pilus assembly protein PilY1
LYQFVNGFIMSIRKTLNSLCGVSTAIAALGLGLSNPARALDLMTEPYLASGTKKPPLVLLTMARDEKLVSAAYNDYSDIDGDGRIDTRYKSEATFKYFGNFSADHCYTYASDVFTPTAKAVNKKCTSAWSGDFLNYITTSRLDALRKSLYGGKRYTDDAYNTVLERAYVPQDSHVWGKEYDATVDNYLISDYTPLSQPTAGRRHFFANVTRRNDNLNRPLMRVLTNRTERVYNWVLKERPVAETDIDAQDTSNPVVPVDYVVRNVVCLADVNLRDEDCQRYTGNDAVKGATYKPVGILHKYGENKAIAFGLLSGSWAKFKSGGVLRRNLEYFDGEVNLATGQFKSNVLGIVNSIDKFRVAQFTGGNYDYNCDPKTGTCADFANPVAEMMYEGLRYLAGGAAPTPSYTYTDSGSIDKGLGLGFETWKSPWKTKADGGNEFAACSKPIQMVISDIKPSFDSDELPGVPSAFASGGYSAPSTPSVLAGFSASTEGDNIWSKEGLPNNSNFFIGHSLDNGANKYDQSASPKLVKSFASIRGLAPESPTRQGTYYAASVAKFGKETNLRTDGTSTRNVDTYAIALSTPLPKLSIPVGTAGNISILPVGKSVSGSCDFGAFVRNSVFPGNRITGFYIRQIFNLPGFPTDATKNGGRATGEFRVGFEDNEEGTDNEMDSLVIYRFQVTAANKLEISLVSEFSAGCIGQHLGFVVGGSTEDGTYLGVRSRYTSCGNDKAYPALGDDPANSSNDVCTNNGNPSGLGLAYSRSFTPSGASGGEIPHDPLWYAVKYGGPKAGAVDPLTNQKLDVDPVSGNPPGYFLVTNPALLQAQLAKAFEIIISEAGTSSITLQFTGASARAGTLVYTPRYETGNWAGAIEAYNVTSSGNVGSLAWSTATKNKIDKTNTAVKRTIYAYDGQTYVKMAGTRFDAASISQDLTDSFASSALTTLSGKANAKAAVVDFLNYLLGDRSLELAQGGKFRNRGALATPADPTVGGLVDSFIGDVVNSTVVYQGKTDLGYATTPLPEASSYPAYVKSKSTADATVFFGANDGMLHAVDANSGELRWSFIPKSLRIDVAATADPSYKHRYFVDGKLTIDDIYSGGSWKTVLVGALGLGGKGMFALDITNPKDPKFLWELDSSTVDAMGNILTRASIVRAKSGPYVLVANGYNSKPDTVNNVPQAALIAIPLTSSPTVTVVAVPKSTVENGLGAASVIDADGVLTNGWAGDLNGDLWRFSFVGNPNTWPAPKKIFTAVRNSKKQPITSPPAITDAPTGGNIVIFGTGRFFETNDPKNLDVQSIYGVIDSGQLKTSLSRTNLANWSIAQSGAKRTLTRSGTGSDFGWYVDLVANSTAKGERVVAAPFVLGGTALFSTIEVDGSDSCAPSAGGWLLGFDYLTGSAPLQSIFGTSGAGPTKVNVAGFKVEDKSANLGDIAALAVPSLDGARGFINVLVGNKGTKLPDPRRFGTSTWRQVR